MNGIVLAGGRSSRMGQDKSMLNYHGIPQYEYVYNLLLPFCEKVFISSNTLQVNHVLPDDVNYRAIGPMAGLLTAFEMEETDWLVIAIDYPLFGAEEILQLLKPSTKIASIFFNPESNFYEPYIGLYRKEFKKIVYSYYEHKVYSLQKILRCNEIEKIIPNDLKVIKSVNSMKELQIYYKTNYE
jgi:molybdopterin-guanine dinucleotide biosynthesis protein A